MKEKWEIRLTAEVNTIRNTRRRINVKLPDAERITIIEAVIRRKNPEDFFGAPLVITTPLHYTEYYIDPDTSELVCCS